MYYPRVQTRVAKEEPLRTVMHRATPAERSASGPQISSAPSLMSGGLSPRQQAIFNSQQTHGNAAVRRFLAQRDVRDVNEAGIADATVADASAATDTSNSAGTCKINGPYPDPNCTPGATLPATSDEVCKSGYSKTVRNVATATKNQVFANYGIASHKAGEYEVDHFISLELGGSNDISNLWPEPAEPRPGFHEKDKVENYLHAQVCSGAMTLEEAQKAISTDWIAVYNQMTGDSGSTSGNSDGGDGSTPAPRRGSRKTTADDGS